MKENHLRRLEAVLFQAENPVDHKDLERMLPEGETADWYLQKLQNLYQDRGINLVRRGNSWAFVTAPDLHENLTLETHTARKLSRAAMETLAIIAYYQPVTRLDIEEIRGVGLSRSTLDHLLDTGWITPLGHRPMPGRPTLWGTTTAFLHHFTLSDLHDLPLREELLENDLLPDNPQGELFHYSCLKTADTKTDPQR